MKKQTKESILNQTILELEDKLKRVQAEFMNFKKRSEQQKLDYLKYEGENVVKDFLPVIDNIDRAITHIPAELDKHEWITGVKNIHKLLVSTMNKLNITKVKTEGEIADYNLHDIISQQNGERDLIVKEVESGYTYNGKLIRAAKVIVGNGEKSKQALD